MSAIKWHKGPPPHVGWWNTHAPGFDMHDGFDRSAYWNWWNGSEWSNDALDTDHRDIAARQAKRRGLSVLQDLLWCDYWPRNARVPRIDPSKQQEQGK